MYCKPGSRGDWARHFELKKKLKDGEANFRLVAASLWFGGCLILFKIVASLPVA